MEKVSGTMRVIYEGLEKDEKLCHIFVKHWMTDIPEYMTLLLLYFLPIGLLIFYSPTLPSQVLAVTWVFASFYFIFFGLAVFIHWLNDFFDFFILTDKRLIDITQERFLVRKTSVAELNQVQHASYKKNGILDYVLDVGVVDVQTAGNKPDLTIEFIKNPAEVTDLILKWSREYKKQEKVDAEEQFHAEKEAKKMLREEGRDIGEDDV